MKVLQITQKTKWQTTKPPPKNSLPPSRARSASNRKQNLLLQCQEVSSRTMQSSPPRLALMAFATAHPMPFVNQREGHTENAPTLSCRDIWQRCTWTHRLWVVVHHRPGCTVPELRQPPFPPTFGEHGGWRSSSRRGLEEDLCTPLLLFNVDTMPTKFA